ncbi:hypothetical protein AKA01nite_11980 [Alkalibacterium kapii]|uniref:Uncharacterized protein n=1 Tax=Alkalibacterium kapii TaxID=426704 RepID=A0A511ATW9_9LACT|nr:hypothetical protein AKA01nite_11980 [Alkalibacterium kapii]
MSTLESATVTKQTWKRVWWNAVNPSSEQPKLWSGHFSPGNEQREEAEHLCSCRQMIISDEAYRLV